MKWFTSDLHLFHKNILNFTNRAYKSVEQMNSGIIQHWNDTVGNKDTVYHLGDFSFGTWQETLEVISKLRGKKMFLKGNHDNKWYDKIKGFEELYNFKLLGHYHEMKMSKKSYVLFHYPIESWHQKNRGSIHLHGHTHGNNSHHANQLSNRYDVGWDVYDKLVTIEEILNNGQ
jgi:calcineurin-like phosphoesterase family protein|tara:strand:+ start:257 stop:775 length:519 start_codon:yes stop_codon:yes gene_type:complete